MDVFADLNMSCGDYGQYMLAVYFGVLVVWGFVFVVVGLVFLYVVVFVLLAVYVLGQMLDISEILGISRILEILESEDSRPSRISGNCGICFDVWGGIWYLLRKHIDVDVVPD